MYDPRPLEDLRYEASLFWIFLRGQWRMASIICTKGNPSVVPGLHTDSWESCRALPAIPVAA